MQKFDRCPLGDSVVECGEEDGEDGTGECGESLLP